MEAQVIFQYPLIPYNQESYTVSFNLDSFDPKEVSQFYKKYGFVVFDDIISEDEAEKTIDEYW